MKINTLKTEPYITRAHAKGNRFLLGRRRKYESYILAMIQGRQIEREGTKTPDRQPLVSGLDETDALALVDDIFKKLERAEVRAKWGEASIQKFIQTVTKRACIDYIRKQKSGSKPPSNFQLKVIEGGASISLLGAQIRAGRVTSSGSEHRDDGHYPDDPRLEAAGTGGSSPSGIPDRSPRDTWGGDPPGIYEARQLGQTDNLYTLAQRLRVKSRNLPLLDALIDGHSYEQIAADCGMTEREVRNRIDYLKRLIWDALKK